MLILTRRPGESFFIKPAENVDPRMTVAELFASGPIEVAVLGVKGNQVRVGTQASDRLNIVRDELVLEVG